MTAPRTRPPTASPAPQTALAPLPGGSTNVFARTIGLPNDPIEATGVLLDALAKRSIRRIGLGSVNDRYFLFHTGVGFDAAVVRQVERRDTFKRWFGHPLFIYATVVTWLRHYDRHHPHFAVRFSDNDTVEDGYFTIVMNTSPYTFLGNRPFDIAPEATFDRGLVSVTVRSLSFGMAWTLARTAFVNPKALRDSRSVDFRSDLEAFEVVGARTVPVPGRRRLPGRDRAICGFATSPTRSRSSSPISQERPSTRSATSGTFVQMPSTPNRGERSHAIWIVDRPHVHLDARRVTGLDERSIDDSVVRMQSTVTSLDEARDDCGGVGHDHRQPRRRDTWIDLADAADAADVERRDEDVVVEIAAGRRGRPLQPRVTRSGSKSGSRLEFFTSTFTAIDPHALDGLVEIGDRQTAGRSTTGRRSPGRPRARAS